jgi:LytS/YehU family sensor histidine kinase
LAPGFFKRHQLIIIGGFAICLSYFIYVRLFANPADHHIEGAVVILFFVPLFTLILLWFYDQWKWFQALKSEKTKAELALLKTQINPHFFFNTLNNLYGLTVEQSKDAPQVVLKLSEMMRYTIYEGKKEVVNLNQEIAYLNNYIELQKIRFHKNVVIEFKHKTDANYEIAPLLFIVSLENAFKHGVDSLRENAFIKMNLIAENDEISFSIENNFDPKEVSSERGIGIENLKKRLALSYPNKYNFLTIIENGIYKSSLKLNLK